MNDWQQVGAESLRVRQRMLMETGDGTVKLLQMDADGYSPLHQHPDRYEWIYVLEGRLETEADGVVQVLDPGDFREFPTQVPHRLNALVSSLALVGAIFTRGVRV